ncbi:universal stress protein [Nocardia sp. NPDC051750]|uniref:universal stress protein n=1 Tax=Nocardia sp. NPDC051750 TaxID=3364325 RepID=UPI003799B7AC
MAEPPAEETGTPIVVGVDGSLPSLRAAAWAGLEARLRGQTLQLLTSCALPPRSGASVPAEAEIEWLRANGEWVLDEAVRAARATAGDSVPITTEVTFELITPTLLDRSASAAMLAVGRRGRGGVAPTVIGSLSSAVTAHAQCPVAVVSGQSGTDPVSRTKPVAVGVDGSPHSLVALETAFAEASRRRVGLVAVHAWSDTSGIEIPADRRPTDEALLGGWMAGPARRYPQVEVERVVRTDAPARTLTVESAWSQLLVVGRRGRGGVPGTVLGATTVTLLYAAECPLMVVHGRPMRN